MTTQLTATERGYETTLGQAIALWRSGQGITRKMAAELLEDGHDLQALERAHRVSIETTPAIN